MERREFLGSTLASTALAGCAGEKQPKPRDAADVTRGGDLVGEVVIERAGSGKPHAGKVLATIAPHSDDHSIMAGGTIAKLIAEGYTGYLIRTSNDEKDSYDLSLGKTVAANEADNEAMAKVLGIKQVFNLDYRNHYMDDVSRVEMRAPADLSVPAAQGRHDLQLRPLGTLRGKPRSLCHRTVRRIGLLDGRRPPGLHRTLCRRARPHSVREKYYYAAARNRSIAWSISPPPSIRKWPRSAPTGR